MINVSESENRLLCVEMTGGDSLTFFNKKIN